MIINQNNRNAAGTRMPYMIFGTAPDRKYFPVLSSRIITDSTIRKFAAVEESSRGPSIMYRKYPQDVSKRESIHSRKPSWVFWDLQNVKSITVRTAFTRKRVKKRVRISGIHMVLTPSGVTRRTVHEARE
jgi:hypothetical protein